MLEPALSRSLQSSLTNIKKNKVLLLLVGALVLAIVLVPSSNRASKELIVTSVTILLVKSESRPQPRAVISVGFLLCALTTVAVINNGELGRVCAWIAVAAMIPLIFSKWLFVPGDQVSHSG